MASESTEITVLVKDIPSVKELLQSYKDRAEWAEAQIEALIAESLIEIPEELLWTIRVCECGAIHDCPEAGCPHCGSLVNHRHVVVPTIAHLGLLQRREAALKKQFDETLRDRLDGWIDHHQKKQPEAERYGNALAAESHRSAREAFEEVRREVSDEC